MKWYFNIKTLNAANKCVQDFITQLDLPNIFRSNRRMIHSSSDGQKYEVSNDCLLASYSFKYFGKANKRVTPIVDPVFETVI